MISLSHAVRVFLHTPPTDLRKGFDALSGLVTAAFSQDPTSGHLFLFVNRRRDRLKILYWDRDGLAIWYKRLETRLIPAPCRRPRCRVGRDESYPVGADPLRYRPAFRSATQAVSAADPRNPKSTGTPL